MPGSNPRLLKLVFARVNRAMRNRASSFEHHQTTG